MRRRKYDITETLLKEALNTITPELRCETLGLIDYLRNKSWKPECVENFNMDWQILVYYPEPEARDKIYKYLQMCTTLGLDASSWTLIPQTL
jgi:hypothetical protein